jgi:glycosyltransferase involved in cell wall biosynthesis
MASARWRWTRRWYDGMRVMKPSVSVLIDTYNHERYIEQAVVSAIEQDFPAHEFEILVVDDGSTDRTPEIVKKFEPRVRLLRKGNGGQASAFNAGVPETRGQFVAFLDGDDWFAPGKLRAVMEAFEEHPDVVAIGHGYYEYHEDTSRSVMCVPAEGFRAQLRGPESARQALRAWKFLIMGALTARRTVFDRLGPVASSLKFCADSPIAVGCLAVGAWICAQPLCYYRHHTTNLHVNAGASLEKLRRNFEIKELMYGEIEALLRRLGVRDDCIAALLYFIWAQDSRQGLRVFGGRRLHALRTEMRSFRAAHPNPTITYRLFKYLVVGGGTLVLSPQTFYRFREWYARRNLGRLRSSIIKSVDPN